MLSGIASYIFGNENADDGHVNGPVVLHATDTEDDWIIIDKDHAACCDMSSSSEELSVNLNVTHSNQSSQNSSPSPTSNSSRVCSPASTDSNGWYVTPPSCFTAGSPPHAMETSPLENLLIEHPSMSVYHRNVGGAARSGSLSSQDSSCSSSSSAYDQSPLESQNGRQQHASSSSRVTRPPQMPSSIPSRASLSERCTHMDKVRPAQRCRQRRQHRMLTRRHLDKQNKAQMNVAKKMKRRDRMCKLASGANNNRKC